MAIYEILDRIPETFKREVFSYLLHHFDKLAMQR
jgi:hypothetical protein